MSLARCINHGWQLCQSAMASLIVSYLGRNHPVPHLSSRKAIVKGTMWAQHRVCHFFYASKEDSLGDSRLWHQALPYSLLVTSLCQDLIYRSSLFQLETKPKAFLQDILSLHLLLIVFFIALL